MDEPTNHLDLATKEMLVEALHDFEGTMLFVSHDRTFLRGLANRGLDGAGKRHGVVDSPAVNPLPHGQLHDLRIFACAFARPDQAMTYFCK